MARRYLSASPYARLRAYYGLSQDELADYLGISTGVLAMAETAEHLGRSLPTPALMRFTELVLWRPAAAEAAAPPLPPTEAETVAALVPGPGWPAPLPAPAQPPAPAALARRRRQCLLYAIGLGTRLAPLELRAAQAARLLELLAALPLPGLPGGPPTVHPRPDYLAAVLAYLTGRAPQALDPTATTARHLLGLRRAALLHEAAAIAALLPPPEELPRS